MGTFITRDGAELYYKDWGAGQPVLFSHGWPYNADMWEYQMSAFAGQGYRCLALDRRGFGRSSQPWDGYTFNVFADDIAAFVQSLDLTEIVIVGFSLGAGEIARYVGRHGTGRIAKMVMISAPLPGPLVLNNGAGSSTRGFFDAARAGLAASRQQFCRHFADLAFGLNRPAAALPSGVRPWLFSMAMLASPKALQDCITCMWRLIFGRISPASTSRHWSCMARTTKSFRLRQRLHWQPARSQAPSSPVTRAHRMGSG